MDLKYKFRAIHVLTLVFDILRLIIINAFMQHMHDRVQSEVMINKEYIPNGR
jgi:hypothetical protein